MLFRLDGLQLTESCGKKEKNPFMTGKTFYFKFYFVTSHTDFLKKY